MTRSGIPAGSLADRTPVPAEPGKTGRGPEQTAAPARVADASEHEAGRLVYAGIGSRQTPPEMLGAMTELARELERTGWHLHSGGADGVAEREELTETGLGSTARCCGRRRHRQANSVRVCSPTSRRVASLRPRSAGLMALTSAPRTLVQTGSCRRCPLIHPLHVVVAVLSRMTPFPATVDRRRRHGVRERHDQRRTDRLSALEGLQRAHRRRVRHADEQRAEPCAGGGVEVPRRVGALFERRTGTPRTQPGDHPRTRTCSGRPAGRRGNLLDTGRGDARRDRHRNEDGANRRDPGAEPGARERRRRPGDDAHDREKDVYHGTREDALWFALGANRARAIVRERPDRTRSVPWFKSGSRARSAREMDH